MARKKLGEFLESYAPGTTTPGKISYTNLDQNGDGLDPALDDLGKEPGSGKPLLEHNANGPQGVSLVNDFLSWLTTEAPNYYKLREGATTAQSVGHLNQDGQANVQRAAENTSAQNVFVKTAESSGTGLGATMSQYSNSGYLDDLGKIVSKLGDITSPEMDEGPGPHSGNALLPIIEGQTSPNVTGKTFVETSTEDASQQSIQQVQKMLLQRNRFNAAQETAFAPFGDGMLAEKMETGVSLMGTRTAQSEYGSFSKTSPVMVDSKLRNIGRSLMLKSLGVDWSSQPGDSEDPNNYDYNNESIIINGTAVDLNSPTSTRYGRAKNTFGAPKNASGGSPLSEGAFEVKQTDLKSYGSNYTPDLTYSGPESREVLRARAAAVVLGMVIATKTVSNSLDVAYSAIDLGRSPGQLGQAKRFSAEAKTQVFERLVMPVTRFPYSDCLSMGLKVLFGTDKMSLGEVTQGAASGHQTINEAPGFWFAIGKSMLQKFASASTSLSSNLESFTSDPFNSSTAIMADITRSGIIGLINTIVQIGDIALFSTGGDPLFEAVGGGVRPFNVDILEEGPQTRVSKSRVNTKGQTSAALAWRGMSMPSLYLLPRNVIKSVIDSNTLNIGPNPVKAHTTTSLLQKSYIDVNGYGPTGGTSRGRIPTDVRRKMEDTLDAEYVPFYFHDIRTNEIIGFHAFLNNLGDSYSANFTSNSGYGRIDPVYIYKDTKRTLTFSFYVVATSKEDFDEMWFKINKLTTLVYPQWSKGTSLIDAQKNKIIQPFSQVIGATPLVRLRIGDVIKGNYSRFNLGRMFGIGTDDFEIQEDTFTGAGKSGAVNLSSGWNQSISDFMLDYVFSTAFGSPLALLPVSGDAGASVADKLVRSAAGTAMEALGGSGIVNPIGAALILGELTNPDSPEAQADALSTSNVVLDGVASLASTISTGAQNAIQAGGGYTATSFPILKPSSNVGYDLVSGDDVTKLRTTVPYRVVVTGKTTEPINSYKGANSSIASMGLDPVTRNKTRYTVKFFDLNAPNVNGEMHVWHEDLMPNPDMLFMVRVSAMLDPISALASVAQVAVNETAAKLVGLPADALNIFTSDAAEFMHPGNNPITRAFENSGGRGLAGVIQSISYDWFDGVIPWETEWGSRAPMAAKVSMTFNVTHDLPPGIDSSGYNRAPIYNVGKTMNVSAGDENPDHGQASHSSYTRAGIKAVQRLKKE